MFDAARYLVFGLLLVQLLTGSASASAAVVINELMASNSHTIADAQEEFDDWIELHNTGDTPVDTAGHVPDGRSGETDEVADPPGRRGPDDAGAGRLSPDLGGQRPARRRVARQFQAGRRR